MRKAGWNSDTVKTVILSHCHHDHAGGLSQFAKALVTVQRKEWNFAQSESRRRDFLYKRPYFDLGQELHLIDGEHDVLADGTIMCIPTLAGC